MPRVESPIAHQFPRRPFVGGGGTAVNRGIFPRFARQNPGRSRIVVRGVRRVARPALLAWCDTTSRKRPTGAFSLVNPLAHPSWRCLIWWAKKSGSSNPLVFRAEHGKRYAPAFRGVTEGASFTPSSFAFLMLPILHAFFTSSPSVFRFICPFRSSICTIRDHLFVRCDDFLANVLLLIAKKDRSVV